MSIVSVIHRYAAAAACASFLFVGCGEKNLEPEKPGTDEPKEEAHFSISIGEIESGAVTYSIKKDDPDKAFYSAIVSDKSLSTLGDNLQSQINAYMEGEIEFYQEMFGLTLEQTLAVVSHSEDIENDYYENLDAESTYHIVAVYITSEGKADGEFEYATFTTADVKPSDNTFEVSYEIAPRSVHISVTPSNNDPYTVLLLREDQIEGTSDAELIQAAVSYYGFMTPVYNEAMEEESKLFAGTKYYLLVFGYEAGKNTTAPVVKVFDAPKGADPNSLEISIVFDDSEVKGYKQHVTVQPNDETIDYLYEVIRSDYSVEEFTAQYKKDVTANAENMGITLAQYLQSFSSFGEVEWDYYLTPGKSYKVAALAVDAVKGELIGDAKFSEIFTPEVPAVSKVNAIVDFEHFYDGDAIKAANEEFSGYEGDGVFIPKITTTAEGATVYYNVYLYEGPGIYTRDAIIASLLEYGTIFKSICYAPFDTPAVIYAVAVDENGLCSQVYEKVFTFKKSEAAAVEGFFEEYEGMYDSFSAKKPADDKLVRKMNSKFLYGNAPKLLK